MLRRFGQRGFRPEKIAPVLRRGEGWSAERDAWREAHDDAVDAYLTWRASGTRTEYAAYRAGAITLDDLAGKDRSRTWGTTLTERSLVAILGDERAREIRREVRA